MYSCKINTFILNKISFKINAFILNKCNLIKHWKDFFSSIKKSIYPTHIISKLLKLWVGWMFYKKKDLQFFRLKKKYFQPILYKPNKCFKEWLDSNEMNQRWEPWEWLQIDAYWKAFFTGQATWTCSVLSCMLWSLPSFNQHEILFWNSWLKSRENFYFIFSQYQIYVAK